MLRDRSHIGCLQLDTAAVLPDHLDRGIGWKELNTAVVDELDPAAGAEEAEEVEASASVNADHTHRMASPFDRAIQTEGRERVTREEQIGTRLTCVRGRVVPLDVGSVLIPASEEQKTLHGRHIVLHQSTSVDGIGVARRERPGLCHGGVMQPLAGVLFVSSRQRAARAHINFVVLRRRQPAHVPPLWPPPAPKKLAYANPCGGRARCARWPRHRAQQGSCCRRTLKIPLSATCSVRSLV